MNRTFKVAKSLTRGVVVTSEKASSYQGKAVCCRCCRLDGWRRSR